MSVIALLGAVELGLVFALVGLAVFLSFRVLDFPDLTVDGSFPLGAAVCATMIVAGWNPWLATGVAILAGGAAGLVTAALNLRFHILHLLASILTMIALYSVNLRIMGGPNVGLLNQTTVLTPFYDLSAQLHEWIVRSYELTPDCARELRKYVRPAANLLVIGGTAAATVTLLGRFLNSQFGLAMRATGANARMARAQGVSTHRQIYVGMALSNGTVGLAGALFAQSNGFADVTIGVGTIVVGLAAVIVGETIFRTRSIALLLVACVAGAVLYRLAIQTALSSERMLGFDIGLEASDLNLITAALVAAALILPRLRAQLGASAR